MTNFFEPPIMDEIINGIQQIGIGVSDTKSVFNWYRKHLGFDILLFKDEAVASLMTRYTNGTPQKRDAYLSLNLRGGGGLEIWQFKDRTPSPPENPVQLVDLGINTMKIRTTDIRQTHKSLEVLGLKFLSEIITSDFNSKYFYFNDPWENRVQIIQDDYSFMNTRYCCGGVMGVVIGVSNMDVSIQFYGDLLGYSNVLVDEIVESSWDDNPEKGKFRRVILQHERQSYGGFGALLGPTQMELVQALDRTPKKIYENRLWGDLGYIHICFDISGMDKLRKKAKAMNHPFTVDSARGFDMGDAAGHFSYIEDPDGTLIEFVETHRVPILKSLGLHLNLRNRNPQKPLPKWLVKTLSFHRILKDLK